MKIDTGFLQWTCGVGFAALCWLFGVHYNVAGLKKDQRETDKELADMRTHYEGEIARLRAEIVAVETKTQTTTQALRESLTRLELRIETGFTQVMEQMRQLFKDQDKRN